MSLFNSPFALRLGLALTTFTTVCLLISTFRTAPPPPLPKYALRPALRSPADAPPPRPGARWCTS